MLEKYMSHIQITSYRICMYCADSTAEGLILSNLLEQINCQFKNTPELIVKDEVFIKHWVHINDLHTFQNNPPKYIKTEQLNKKEWKYIVDIPFLESQFQNAIRCRP